MPSRLKALVTFRVRELLTQPWPPGAGSASCGGSCQAWAHGVKGSGEGRGEEEVVGGGAWGG